MSIKEFFRLVSIFTFSFLGAFISVRFIGDRLFVVFDDIIFILSAIATFYAAASWTFLNYLDGIIKDFSGLKEYNEKNKYIEAINKFGILKAEIVHNIILIILLFLSERLAGGIFSFVYNSTIKSYQLIPNIFFSVRLACLSVAIFAVFCHLKGFVVALEYRNIIARYIRK